MLDPDHSRPPGARGGARTDGMAMTKRNADFAGRDVSSLTSVPTAARESFALSIVVEARDSTSARAGAKADFDVEGAVMSGG